MNLRELTSDQNAILAQVESGDFSLDDVSDHLTWLEEDRNKKIESYLHVINRLSSEVKTLHDETARLHDIAVYKIKSLDNIKAWLLMSMKDGEKHHFDLFKVSRVKGRQVATITDETLLDDCYTSYRRTRHIDKIAILKDLKGGAELKGAELSTGNPILRIK